MQLERRNAYFCKDCRKVTITVDVDEGVTPAFILCPHCHAMANTFMYQVPGCMRFDFSKGISILPADMEWYKPNEQEYKGLTNRERDHVKKGGLLSRKRTDRPAIMFELPPKQTLKIKKMKKLKCKHKWQSMEKFASKIFPPYVRCEKCGKYKSNI